MAERAPIIELAPEFADREVHWFFGDKIGGHFAICDEYVTGDVVLGDPGDNRDLVNCPECLEWIHA